ncbi:restriction endonuclease subunit S [Prevotella koreensis]
MAKWLLLKELGIVGETQDQQKAVVKEKRLSLSFLSSGRLDAEYYQPKYDYLDTQLSSIPTKRLGEMVEIQKSVEPGSEAYREEGVPFVRVANLSKFGIDSPGVHLDRKAFFTAPRPKKNTILLSKDGSVGIAYKMEEDDEIITSGAILHLSVKDKNVLPDYLTLLLNSPIVRMQAERDAGGSIIQHWKPSEIAQVVIPILPAHIQQNISERVSKSFVLRRESKALLDEAKLMVEYAIEHFA